MSESKEEKYDWRLTLQYAKCNKCGWFGNAKNLEDDCCPNCEGALKIFSEEETIKMWEKQKEVNHTSNLRP